MASTGQMSSIRHETWPFLRDNRFVEQLLDTLAQPKMMKSQPETLAWQDAMIRLGDAVVKLRSDSSVRAKPIIKTLQTRFPPIMAFYSHPLACIRTNPLVAPAVISISAYLTELAKTDTFLIAYLRRHSVLEMALLSFLAELPKSPVSYRFVLPPTLACRDMMGALIEGRDREALADVVGKFGLPNVADAIDSFLLRPPEQTREEEFRALITVSGRLSNVKGMSKYFTDRRTPVKLMRSLWKALTTFKLADIRLHGNALDLLLTQFNWVNGPSQATAVFVELVETCEMTAFCAQCSLLDAFSSKDRSADDFSSLVDQTLRHLAKVSRGGSSDTANYIRPYLLSTLDCVREQDFRQYPRMRGALASWVGLIEACGTTEKELRQSEKEKNMDRPGMIGCSWLHCIFHGGEYEGSVGRRMLLDNRCLAVQYCSLACQKSDWHHGRHRFACHSVL